MTSWLPDVVPDEVIESAWGNTIRDRTATPFATAAARTTAIPTPTTGMVTYQIDTKRLEVWDGAQWSPIRATSLSRYRQITATNNLTNPSVFTPLPAGADRTALQANFVKLRGATPLVVRFGATVALGSGVAQVVYAGIKFGTSPGVDVECCLAPLTTAAPARGYLAGIGNSTSVPSGTHAVEPVFRTSAGSVISWFNGNDFISYEIEEQL